MIEIFIPVIWICINANCAFMQSEGYFRREAECERSLERHKQHMRNLVKEAGQGVITVLEGTCVDVQIKSEYEQRI